MLQRFQPPAAGFSPGYAIIDQAKLSSEPACLVQALVALETKLNDVASMGESDRIAINSGTGSQSSGADAIRQTLAGVSSSTPIS